MRWALGNSKVKPPRSGLVLQTLYEAFEYKHIQFVTRNPNDAKHGEYMPI